MYIKPILSCNSYIVSNHVLCDHYCILTVETGYEVIQLLYPISAVSDWNNDAEPLPWDIYFIEWYINKEYTELYMHYGLYKIPQKQLVIFVKFSHQKIRSPLLNGVYTQYG